MNYVPDLRTPLVTPLAPMNYHPTDCPRSMQEAWENEESADVHLTQKLARMAVTGRGIFTMPMGKVPGWYPASQWHSGEEWRQKLLVSKINDWCRAKRGRTIEIFVGFRVQSPYHLTPGGRPPQPGDVKAMGDFVANVLPWVTNIKLHRLILDNTSTTANYPYFKRLVKWCQSHWGLTVTNEAFVTQHIGAGEWLLDQDALEFAPGYATSSFVTPRDSDQEWVVPHGCEALVTLRQQDNPTQEWVDSLRMRGFTVGSISPSCDQYVL